MATSTTQYFLFGTKNVTTAGTAEAIDTATTPITGLVIIAHDDNTGRVYYGGSDVASTTQRGLAAGESVTFSSPGNAPFFLGEIFLDVSVSSEGADFIATRAHRGTIL